MTIVLYRILNWSLSRSVQYCLVLRIICPSTWKWTTEYRVILFISWTYSVFCLPDVFTISSIFCSSIWSGFGDKSGSENENFDFGTSNWSYLFYSLVWSVLVWCLMLISIVSNHSFSLWFSDSDLVDLVILEWIVRFLLSLSWNYILRFSSVSPWASEREVSTLMSYMILYLTIGNAIFTTSIQFITRPRPKSRKTRLAKWRQMHFTKQ